MGTQMAFEQEFAEPIKAGSYAGSSRYKIDIAYRTALRLQHLIRPYLLRRRKGDANVALVLPAKKEQVLFCRLSSVQRSIYREIIGSPEVERAIRHRRPLFR
jgi:DNA excision repair protein ERCC-6